MKHKLTQERLKELLNYDPKSGVFAWKVEKGRAGVGTNANYKNNRGYLQVGIDGRFYLAHRLAFLYMEGYIPEKGVDHIDRNKTNNRWDNLREVSHLCNTRNRPIRSDNKSGVIGIRWHKASKKWNAYIKHKKQIHLGLFDSISDATKARWEAEVKYNFPNCNTTSSAYNYLKENKLI